jgi:hypothetical protein
VGFTAINIINITIHIIINDNNRYFNFILGI